MKRPGLEVAVQHGVRVQVAHALRGMPTSHLLPGRLLRAEGKQDRRAGQGSGF